MANTKTIGLIALGLLIVIGVVIALVLRSRSNNAATPGQRLLAHSRDRSDYRMFVGMPANQPTSWAEVSRIDASSVTLPDSNLIKLADITAYFVTYPSGTLADREGPASLELPAWISGLHPADQPEDDELSLADLTAGQSIVYVSYGRSTAQPTSRNYYSTTLKNVSDRRVRVLKFAGYSRSGSTFKLNTVSRQFFSAIEFKEWYGQTSDWIGPGESVTDPNNYGGPPMLWAYYCESEGGGQFVTGGVLE